MKPTTDGTDSQPVASDIPASEPPQRTADERWMIRGAIVIVVGLICVAVGGTVGRDLVHSLQRLPIFRQKAPPLTAETAMPDPLNRSDPADDSDEYGQRNRKLPSDAMVVPPRRKRSSPKPTEAPRQEADLDRLIDALVVENTAQETASEHAAAAGQTNGSAVPADLTTNLLEAAARLVSQSWQDFDYPVDWPGSETSKSRMIFVSHRNRILKGTAHPNPSALSLDQFRKDYATAHAQFPDDPRLDYAFGLVLWKHKQHAEAIEMFQTASRLDDVPFLPAALAVAWSRFLEHEDRQGLDHLAHISRRLAACTDNYPTDAQKEQAAMAMGRALGYLAGPDRCSETAEFLELSTQTILARLPESLRDECEAGRGQIASRQSELMQLAALPSDQVAQDHQRHRDQLQTQIDSLRGEMQAARNVMTRNHITHVEKVKEIKDEVQDVRGQMEKLRPKLQQKKEDVIDLSSAPTAATINSPSGQPGQLGSPFGLNSGSPFTGGQNQQGRLGQQNQMFQQIQQYQQSQMSQQDAMLLPETASERQDRISQLKKSREEMKQIEKELADLRDRQRELVAERKEADAKEKQDKAAAQRAVVARLKEQQELEQQLQSLAKALRRTSTLRDSIETIAAYVPWNVEVEGEAIWMALTPKSTPAPR